MAESLHTGVQGTRSTSLRLQGSPPLNTLLYSSSRVSFSCCITCTVGTPGRALGGLNAQAVS